MSERFESHSRTFAGLTLVSRVTGLARDATLSRIFGAAGVMDAFFFAFLIPNLFRRLFGEGALGASFLATYAKLERSDPALARRLATLTVALVVVGLGGVTLIGELVLAAVGHLVDEGPLALRLTMVMLPYIPMVCLVAILGTVLQVHGRFGPTAGVPIVLNLCLIAAALGLMPLFGPDDPHRHIEAVAVAVLVAGLLQVAWCLWALRDRPLLGRGLARARAPMGRVLRQAAPMVLGLGVLQLNTFFDGVIASYPTLVGRSIFGVDYPLEPGAMAAVSFAQRLYQFPLGVFGIAVATAIYPALVRQSESAAYADILRRGLRLVVFIGLPASAGLMLVGRPLVTVILEGGAFTALHAERAAAVLFGYASAVWAYSMIHVLTRAFYARGDTTTPVKVAAWMVCLNLALNCTLIWTPLREAGLAWSTAICATIQSMVLMATARRRTPGILAPEVLTSGLRTLAITAVMVMAVGAVLALAPAALTWSQSLANVVMAVGVGVLVVYGSARALRMPELSWVVGGKSQNVKKSK